MDANQIFQEALNDETLHNTIDVNELLSTVDKVGNDYLNKTIEEIYQEVVDTLSSLGLPDELFAHYCQKLMNHRVVLDSHEYHSSVSTRFLIRPNEKCDKWKMMFGISTNLSFTDNGMMFSFIAYPRRFMNLRFDNCIAFQELTPTELMILTLSKHVAKNPASVDNLEVDDSSSDEDIRL